MTFAPLRTVAVLALLLPLGTAGIATGSTAMPAKGQRCGWVQNPTPGNWWLTDRDGDWEMAMQGGYEAPGMGEVPDLTESEWVSTNGPAYGYACVCMTADIDARKKRITHIYSVHQQSLATCRHDPNLPAPE